MKKERESSWSKSLTRHVSDMAVAVLWYVAFTANKTDRTMLHSADG